jgi:hypothetical protein
LHFLLLELFFLSHGLDGGLLLIDDFIEDHFEVLVRVVPFFFDVLDLSLDARHFIIFLSHICEFTLIAICELIGGE